MKLGFLASHNGSNMQAIIDACRSGQIKAAPVVVISNNPDSGALQRARRESIPACHLSSRSHPDPAALEQAILQALQQHETELVILAGYMKKLGPAIISAYRNRILNIHPSLLPAYGGHGMYGEKVHHAVLQAGEKETGASVHLVDEHYDNGRILAQTRVPVQPSDNINTLAARVLQQEHELYVQTVADIVTGKLPLP
ncbi:MAG: phosphoribosylglycinamide formyltransferase [Gammaproteobacteria bacterium]